MGGQGMITHFIRFKYFKKYLKYKKSKNISIHEKLFFKFWEKKIQKKKFFTEKKIHFFFIFSGPLLSKVPLNI